MKKALGFITVVAAATVAMCASAYAATYTVESKSAKPGEEVTLKVKATPSGNDTTVSVNGYAVQISYDASVLEPVATENEDVLGSTLYATNDISDDNGVFVADVVSNDSSNTVVAVAWASTTAATGAELDLAEVTFKVLETATDSSTDLSVTVKADAVDADTLAESSEGASGTVTLGKEYLLGDLNNDTYIDGTDFTLIGQLVSKAVTLDELDKKHPGVADRANVNKDTDESGNPIIDGTDFTLIGQYVSKAITSFE
jgi:hypothetical protein